MQSPGIILLAAGGSSRMGHPKQLLPFGPTTLLRHACQTALETSFRPVVVVLGAEAEKCAAEISGLSLTCAINPQWEEGMGGSIRIGIETLEHISPAAERALILLHDQPLISATHLLDLAKLCRPPDSLIAASAYDETCGVPAVFDRSLFPELKALPATEGARKVIMRHRDRVTTLPLPEAASDVDTPEDYQLLTSKHGA
jgi:CTP:molybdopterin cytidylyltransferase MocA